MGRWLQSSPWEESEEIHHATLPSQNLNRVPEPAVEQKITRMAAKEQAANAQRVRVTRHSAQVRHSLDAPDSGHDFGVPATSNFWRGFLGEMSNTFLEINPELWPEDGLHVPLPDRASPRWRASVQSSDVAGRAGPLFMASSTHCW